MRTSRLCRFICLLVLTPALMLAVPAGAFAAHGSSHVTAQAAAMRIAAQIQQDKTSNSAHRHAGHAAGKKHSAHTHANHDLSQHDLASPNLVNADLAGQKSDPAQLPHPANGCCDAQNCHAPALPVTGVTFHVVPASARAAKPRLGAGIPPGQHADRLERPPRSPAIG